MKRSKKAAGLLLAGALFVGVPLSGYAKDAKKPEKKDVQYVALGDSLAAGQTPYNYIDYGYADFIADYFVKNKYKLKDFDNFGVPGYTSEKLKNDLEKSKKIRKEVKEATHITIDIGANDLLPKIKTDPANAKNAIGSIGANLEVILSAIDQLNPKVKVYIMGYYNPYPYLPKEQQEILMPLLKGLNIQIEAVAKKHGDMYVATEVPVASNYAEYLPNPLDIHLSEKGYKALANEFWKQIIKSKK